MVVVPLIFFSLIAGVTSMTDLGAFRRIGAKAVVAFFGTCAFAVTIAWAVTLRSRTEWHRRMMFGGTFLLLEPALGHPRQPGPGAVPAAAAVSDPSEAAGSEVRETGADQARDREVGAEGGRQMTKRAPSIAQIAVMVAFTLSCFGILLYVWRSFGGQIPLAPKQYRVVAGFHEATSLSDTAEVRISGVPVGRVVKLIESLETLAGSRAGPSCPAPPHSHAVLPRCFS